MYTFIMENHLHNLRGDIQEVCKTYIRKRIFEGD